MHLLATLLTALVMLLAGCSGSDDTAATLEQPTAPAGGDAGAAPDDGATPVSTVDEPVAGAASSQIAISDAAPQTTVTAGGAAAASSVQQRISDLLTDLETRDGTGGSTSIVLPEAILFDFDRADLKPSADAALAKIAEVIELADDDAVEVQGHTDAKGSDSYNQDLSQRRADAVRDALVDDHGVDGGALSAEGFGEAQPVAPNTNDDGSDNPQGRQQNRRVEVLVDGIEGAG